MHNLNIVMPMAGRGARFVNAGYQIPKQLIEVKGKKVIEWAISSLPDYGNFIFIVHAEQNRLFNISSILKNIVPLCTIIETDQYTEGPACTSLLAQKYIDIDHRLIIADSDFYTKWDYHKFLDHVYFNRLDACAVCEFSNNPKNSYVTLDNRNLIVKAAEKQVISNISPHGIHYYRHGSIFIDCAEEMIKRDMRYNNEFYITPIYNILAEYGYKCGVYFSDRHYPLGIPEDIRAFEND